MHQLRLRARQGYFINTLLWSNFGVPVTFAGAINQGPRSWGGWGGPPPTVDEIAVYGVKFSKILMIDFCNFKYFNC